VLRFITIALSVIGLFIGIYAVATAKQPEPQLPLARQPSVNPYTSGVAALGIVEASAREASLVAPESRLVTRVLVEVGQAVQAGQALFELDARHLDAELLRARAGVDVAQAEIARWHAIPRAEDLPPLRASVARAQALLEDQQERLRLQEQARDRGASVDRDVSLARFARDAAQAELDRANAELARTTAGGWKADLILAQAVLKQREAEAASLEVLRERMTIRAPGAGIVLRRDIEPGELASVDPSRPALLIGNTQELNVRAQVDEEDIALIAQGAHGVARTRGSVVRDIPLTLLRIEPFARPKTDLTGSNVERVDTRVIDVVLKVDALPEGAPIYPGQALDVFLESKPRGADSANSVTKLNQ
jgi:multidrug efflux pump subunit AcrA (membrane-fusion protein)